MGRSLSRAAHAAVSGRTPTSVLLRWLPAAALAACAALSSVTPARADPETQPLPDHFTVSACHNLALDTGRMIAWARWEQRYPLEKVRFDPYEPGTPDWVISLTEGWVKDAYQWRATDDQVLQWASELGSTQYLPKASQLTKHEHIAIWLRRIARNCEHGAT